MDDNKPITMNLITPFGKYIFFIDKINFRVLKDNYHEKINTSPEKLISVRLIKDNWSYPKNSGWLKLEIAFESKKKDKTEHFPIALSNSEHVFLLQTLNELYPDKTFFNENKHEKLIVLSDRYFAEYRLYVLPALKMLGVFNTLALILLMLILTMPAPGSPSISAIEWLKHICIFFISISLVFFAGIGMKKIFILLTNPDCLVIRRLFLSVKIRWEDLIVNEISGDTNTIYSGIYCFCVAESKEIAGYIYTKIKITDKKKSREHTLLLPYSQDIFLRELFYRGKIDYSTSLKHSVFYSLK